MPCETLLAIVEKYYNKEIVTKVRRKKKFKINVKNIFFILKELEKTNFSFYSPRGARAEEKGLIRTFTAKKANQPLLLKD